jgi:hypothetical protein
MEYRLRLNDLGQRWAFPKTPNRTGVWLGEAKLQYSPDKLVLPRWKVLWDGWQKPSTILKSYVEFDGDVPPGVTP